MEIESWCRLTRTPLAKWEVSILRQLDAAFLRVGKEMDEKYNPPPDTKKAGRKM